MIKGSEIWAVGWGALLWAACSADPGGGDAGGPDASALDSGSDAGLLDAAPADGGLTDPGPFRWPVPTGPISITPHGTLKNRLTLPDDPFIVDPSFLEAEGLRYVKFAVLLRDPTRVYFQDTHAYPFHYEFVTERLDPFLGHSRATVDLESLHEAGQEVVLGAIVLPRDRSTAELGIQFVRQDAYHPEMVRQLFKLVEGALDGANNTRAFYFPTYEQAPAAEYWRAWLAAREVLVGSPNRWTTQDSCYASGWGLGRLRYVPGSEIGAAYTAGELLPSDILYTDGVPAEVPYVTGILSQSPATPSSHVAILAHSYAVPFGHSATPSFQARAQALLGHDVLFAAHEGPEGCQLELLDLDGTLSPTARAELLALKNAPPLAIRAKQRKGAISASVDGLSEADLVYFGGKAVGYGLLRATIPEHAPPAIALSFDLWDQFLDQDLASTGGPLRAEISRRLAVYSFPPDPRALADDLSAIRDLIRKEAQFNTNQQTAILSALASFEPSQRLRFRSSTNVEDTDSFTGAGLYDSETGCAADEQDQDAIGPSACNPDQAEERGVFRALQKVYASFYSDAAVRERLRLGVNEAEVGMAVLVHYSYPDEDELGNGVATFAQGPFSADLKMVSQHGAVSITNPDGHATPEITSAYVAELGIYFDLIQRSSLGQLGATVFDYPSEYESFAALFEAVSARYGQLHPELDRYTLDFEYKKTRGEGLVVKQARRLPEPSPEANQPVYLWARPTELCTYQGETADVFSNHRLKVRYQLTPRGAWLAAPEPSNSLYAEGALRYVSGATTAEVLGAPSAWPSASYGQDGEATIDSYALGPDQASLHTTLIRTVRPTESPLLSVDHLWLFHQVDYATPVPALDWTGPVTRDQDLVVLSTCPEANLVTPKHHREVDHFQVGSVTIDTAYWWPYAPTGATAGYTAPLYRWDQTTVTGLSTEPIVLKGYWSQTYRPMHHNFGAEYIFDPWLEPGVSAASLAELRAANIRWIYTDRTALWALGLDGSFRQL